MSKLQKDALKHIFLLRKTDLKHYNYSTSRSG